MSLDVLKLFVTYTISNRIFKKIQLKIGTIGRNFSTENTFLQEKIKWRRKYM